MTKALPESTAELIRKDGTRAFTGNQSLGSNKLTNVTDPTAAQDAATKSYVDGQTGTDPSFDSVTLLNEGKLKLREATGNGTHVVELKAPAAVTADVTFVMPGADGTANQVIKTDGAGNWSFTDAGSGDVSGAASSTDNALPRYNGTTGKVIQGSGLVLNDADEFTTKIVIDVGTTPATALEIKIAQPTAAGTRDSHDVLLTGTAYDTAGHDADWKAFVDVTSNAGASTYTLQSRIDAAAFATRISIDDAGKVTLTGDLDLATQDILNANLTSPTVTTDVTLLNEAEIRLSEATGNGTHYAALKAAAAMVGNVTWTLPDADGANGEVLQTNGSGVWSWVANGGGGSSEWTDSGTYLYSTETGDSIIVGASTAPLGKIHAYTGASGVGAAAVNADELVLEGANPGLSILCPNTNLGTIAFGDPEDDNVGRILYSHSSDTLDLRASGTVAVTCHASGNVTLGGATLPGTSAVSTVVIPNGTKPTTSPANAVQLYAFDVAASSELFVRDEAGTETQLSAHAMDAPTWLYDQDDPFPHVFREANYQLGIIRFTNFTRQSRLVGILLGAGQVVPKGKKCVCTHTETFSEYNKRLKLKRDQRLKTT